MHHSRKFLLAGISILLVTFYLSDSAIAGQKRVRRQQRFAQGTLPQPQFADPDRGGQFRLRV